MSNASVQTPRADEDWWEPGIGTIDSITTVDGEFRRLPPRPVPGFRLKPLWRVQAGSRPSKEAPR